MPICNTCNENKNESEFYIRSETKKPYSTCKQCANKRRMKYYKPTTYQTQYELFDQAIKDQIKQDYRNRMSLKAIARKNNINYTTFYKWVQKQLVEL